jgi:hypothetical protein
VPKKDLRKKNRSMLAADMVKKVKEIEKTRSNLEGLKLYYIIK